MCDHLGPNGGALVCDRTTDHDPAARGGHTYAAAWWGDDHDRSEARDD
jgi:hypothetical protein